MPKLSIVVPVYNVEKYLNQCIDSILEQSFADFELIIVDDGSTDCSGSICDQYARSDKRVTVLHTENHGVVTARRTGVNCAQGEYTAFVDSDDWLDPDFYGCIFGNASKTDADVLICRHVIRATGCVETTSIRSGHYNRKEMESAVFPQMMYDMCAERYHIVPSLWDKIFRTELLKEVYKGVDPIVTLGEDAVCTYPCIAKANSLLVIENSACYHYREDHISMVNHCDVRLLQRVSAFAVNMNQQFSAFPEFLGRQAQWYIACVGLYAARQVLLYNRELSLYKRSRAVKDFLGKPEVAQSFAEANKTSCSVRLKWELHFAIKKRPYLLMLSKIVFAVQKLKLFLNRDLYARN